MKFWKSSGISLWYFQSCAGFSTAGTRSSFFLGRAPFMDQPELIMRSTEGTSDKRQDVISCLLSCQRSLMYDVSPRNAYEPKVETPNWQMGALSHAHRPPTEEGFLFKEKRSGSLEKERMLRKARKFLEQQKQGKAKKQGKEDQASSRLRASTANSQCTDNPPLLSHNRFLGKKFLEVGFSEF